MKRIVYCIDNLSVAGGIGRIITCKANWLAEHGYCVSILTTEDESNESFYPLSEKVRVVALNIKFLSVYKNKRNFIGLVQSYLDRKKKLRKFRHVLSQYLKNHPCDIFFTTANYASILRLKDGSRKIYETHFSCESQRRFEMRLRPFFRIFYSLYNSKQDKRLRRYDALVLLTEKDRNLRGDPKNAIVIPNFITLQVPGNQLANTSSQQAIAVGRLDDVKNFKALIQAWAMVHEIHEDWKLNIYGQDSGEQEHLLREIQDKKLTTIVNICPPTQNILEKYLQSSFYVLSSKFEGFPLVLGEAMTCGLPCIAFDCNCGPSEIIRNGEDGMLVRPEGNVQKLAEAINWMIEHPAERCQMGIKATRNIQRFSIDNVMPRWVKLIENK